jgi:pimeloyl-ACP methyl ester carboxylesterase
LVREANAYTSRPQARAAVRERVAAAIRSHRPRVVVAHSLGSVVAYEALHAFPELEVELLVTLGSPLGLPTLARRLEPAMRHGQGARPAGVERWVNIADGGDLVALPPKLGGLFPVDTHATTDIGWLDPHTLGGYLANGVTAAAIAPYLSS